ncbi:vWA domain-containing protein [Alkalihalobacillus pseudalcaliphilus]|uniref:vWA domain-containing protein n=1 Tax=Alkalihalobacillus pseudalcaliphilus TaxID=79884 RepID=UPI00064DF4AC|nr:VWA domain-containing protein [Alkalihalobacillus pseudalcaliphilus]KMK76368.1 hypothetical protein AB990_14325 [Alkalihalobacillus pseudalcaliphilus]
MGVIAPWFLTTSIFLVGLIAIYMFKKQYEDHIVSSDLFWREALNEWQATKWWHRLQRHLLFYLQFLIILLLVIGLSRPYFENTEHIEGEHIFILLDGSASMLAYTEQGNTRFDEAKDEVMNLLEQVHKDQFVSVLLVGNTAEPIVLQGENSRMMRQSVEELTPNYETANFDYAFSFVEAVAKEQDISVHIYSDRFTIEAEDERTYPYYVSNFGEEEVDNIGLVNFVLMDSEEKAYIEVYNENNKSFEVPIQLRVDGELLDEQMYTVEPGASYLELESVPSGEKYELSLLREDQFSLDNTFISFRYPSAEPTIYAIGDLSPFVLQTLNILHADVVSADKWTDILDPDPNAVIVTDSDILLEEINRPIIFIATHQAGPLQYSKKEVLSLKPEQSFESTLFNFQNISEVYISEARQIENELDTEVLVKSDEIPLIEKGQLGQVPFISINFDIHDSDWPLHYGFPIFFYQAIEELANNEAMLGYFEPSEHREIRYPDVGQYDLIHESGKVVTTLSSDQREFQAPKEPGYYELVHEQDDTIRLPLYVTLPTDERTVQAFPSFEGGETLSEQAKEQSFQNDLLFWFVLLAFIILFVEWEVYRREYRI